MGTLKESQFQAKLIKDIKKRFPGAMVLKNDPDYIQGIPDLLVLYEDKWATLECKRSSTSAQQPNQEYYIRKMDGMSFSKIIFPENKEEILNELARFFSP